MSLSYPVRSNIGAAAAATLASPGISNTATTGSTFTVTGLSGFFDVATGSAPSASNQVVMAIEYGTTNVEKILCTYSGGTFTIVSRNYDSTSTSVPTHAAGVSVIPVFSANEAAEHNAAVQSLKHVLTSGSGGTSTDPGLITVSSGAGSRGSAPYAANSDHSHTLSNSQLATWISTPATVPGSSVTGALAAATTLDAAQLTAASTGTALPANVTLSATQLVASTPGTALPANVTLGASQLTGTLTTAQLAAASGVYYTSITSGSIPSGTTFPSTPQISQSVTGFPSYLITFTCTAKNLDTTAAHNVLAEIGFGVGSTAGSATQIASTLNTVSGVVGGTNTGFSALTCTYVVGSQTPATTYTAGGYVTIGGSTAGSIVNATLSIVGLA